MQRMRLLYCIAAAPVSLFFLSHGRHSCAGTGGLLIKYIYEKALLLCVCVCV